MINAKITAIYNPANETQKYTDELYEDLIKSGQIIVKNTHNMQQSE